MQSFASKNTQRLGFNIALCSFLYLDYCGKSLWMFSVLLLICWLPTAIEIIFMTFKNMNFPYFPSLLRTAVFKQIYSGAIYSYNLFRRWENIHKTYTRTKPPTTKQQKPLQILIRVIKWYHWYDICLPVVLIFQEL